jgi:hypothetical protein
MGSDLLMNTLSTTAYLIVTNELKPRYAYKKEGTDFYFLGSFGKADLFENVKEAEELARSINLRFAGICLCVRSFDHEVELRKSDSYLRYAWLR